MPELNLVIATGELENVQQSDFQKPANGGQSPTTKEPVKNVQSAGSSNLIAQSVYANQLVGLAKQQAMNWVNFAKSSYGDYTGDYLGQRKLDRAFELGSTVIGFASSVGMGFASGGPVGAAVAAVVSAASIAGNAIQANIQYTRSINMQNAGAAFNASRMGEILINGNRG